MARSFGIVEYKLLESDYFLEKIKNCGYNLFEARFLFSAFLSASRSVTFALQASLNQVEGFDKWYETQQDKLRKDELARFFVQARNESQKIGVYHINAVSCYRDENGLLKGKYYFSPYWQGEEKYPYVPSEDIVSASEKFLTTLLELIWDCFQQYGSIIDPEQFWMLKNLKKTYRTIEDVEEGIGYPRGWTNLENTVERPLNEIEDELDEDISFTNEKSLIEGLFVKYLEKDKYGNIIKKDKITPPNIT